MAEPFQSRAAGAGGLLAGMAVRRTTRALREIEALLAGALRIRALPTGALAAAATTHGVDLATEVTTQRQHLYGRFLEHCLKDHAVSAEESAELAHLQQLLCLDDAEAGQVHARVAQAVYGQAIDQVLGDHRLDPEEEAFLQTLRKELGLPEAIAEQLEAEGARRARSRFLDQTIVHDQALVVDRQRMIEVRGESRRGLEDAVRSAIAEVGRALPDARTFEVTHIRAEREGDGLCWRVVVRGRLDAPEHEA